MSNFKDFKEKQQLHITSMLENTETLFVTDTSKDDLWETYLESFPAGTNEIFRERREYDCQCCRQFIRAVGRVVTVENNKLVSIWDIPGLEYPYNIVAEQLSRLVKDNPIKNTFLTECNKVGTDSNNSLLDGKDVQTFQHFYYNFPNKFVNKTSRSLEAIQSTTRSTKEVFQRALEELSMDALDTTLEIIAQGSLYKGDEFKGVIEAFRRNKIDYDKLSDDDRNIWVWVNSLNNFAAKIRNSAIGTLLIDLSANVELDEAVRKFEAVVAPTNYKRPKELFTKKMVEDAEKKIVELGLADSLSRKHAVLEDITVNNVLFVNRDAAKQMQGSILGDLKKDAVSKPQKFDKVEEVSINDFVENILPNTRSMEVLMENTHQSNLMSLVAPVNKDAKSMMKWDNNFSWSYNGDITDSMKERVKKAGGNVEGVLRFSIQWNDKGDNNNDFDAHCIEPNGNRIYFSSPRSNTSGFLDVDIQYPKKDVAVENITWTDINKMREGEYNFKVHNFAHRGGKSGFTAEIEYNGEIHTFVYDKELKNKSYVDVATINFSKKDGITFKKKLPSTVASKEIWGVKTHQFTKVSTMMFSPNFWDGQEGIGNKHFFFFLEGCKTDSSPRGFYNEFLPNELLEHKRVFAALGNKMRVEPTDEQLSGLGFSSTQRNSLVVKVEGSFTRVIRIKF